MIDYKNDLLDSFPSDLAESLLGMALERTKITRENLSSLSETDRRRLEEVIERLVTAADVPDTPCGH